MRSDKLHPSLFIAGIVLTVTLVTKPDCRKDVSVLTEFRSQMTILAHIVGVERYQLLVAIAVRWWRFNEKSVI